MLSKIKFVAQFGDSDLSVDDFVAVCCLQQPVREGGSAYASSGRAEHFENRAGTKQIQIRSVRMHVGAEFFTANSPLLPLMAQSRQTEVIEIHDPLDAAVSARILRE